MFRNEALVAEAEPEFASAGDDFGLYLTCKARGEIANMQGRPDAMMRAYDDMAEHSRRKDHPRSDIRAHVRIRAATP